MVVISVTVVDLNTVVKNRRAIIAKALEEGKFNTLVYACFFETKSKVIAEDVNKIDPEGKYSTKAEISLSQLQAERASNDSFEVDDNELVPLLEKWGIWHKPIDVISINEIVAKINKLPKINKTKGQAKSESYTDKMIRYAKTYEDVFLLLQYGASKKDIKKYFGYDDNDIYKVNSVAKIVGISTYPDDEMLRHVDIKAIVDELVDKGNSILLIEQATGIAKKKLYDIKKNNQKKTTKKKTKNKIEKKQTLEERRKKVWELYYGEDSKGYTMDDIANVLGISRQTVASDIREYKLKCDDAGDVTRYTRHSGAKQYKRHIEQVHFVKTEFEAYMATHPTATRNKCITEVSKITEISISQIYKILEELEVR